MDSPSPFSPFLGTNYAATAQEIAELADFLSEPISKLAKLKEELDVIQAHYHAVLQEYNTLSKSIDNHRALMAPIRRIPADIFREIFIQCLPHEHNAIMSKHECPLLLTQICSSWRHIALNTPALWRSIHIPMPNYDALYHYDETKRVLAVARESCRVELIKHWLSRSGSTTLNISLYHGLNIPLMEIYNIILDTLIPFSPRWGTLQCPASFFGLERIANLDVNQLPRLHTIALYDPSVNHRLVVIPGGPPNQPLKWKDSTFIHAPNLRSISCKQEGIQPTIYRLPLQWGRLTKIEFTVGGILSIARFATHLVGCHQLETLCIGLTYPQRRAAVLLADTDSYSMPATVSLPFLTSLSVVNRHSWNLSGLFDALDTPILEDLEVLCTQESHPSLLAFLTRVSQTLRHLVIDPLLFMHNNDFCTFLSTFDNIVTLELRPVMLPRPPRVVLDDEFLHQLLIYSEAATGGSVLLPHLAHFTCGLETSFTDVRALETIRRRNDIASSASAGTLGKLKTVKLQFKYPQRRPLLAELEQLAAEDGVRCMFKFQSPPPENIFSPAFGTPKWVDPKQFGYELVAF